jgi:hypothetical protein
MRHVFGHTSGPLVRSTVHDALDQIRMLRNRVAHYEHILHMPLNDRVRDTFKLLTWLSPTTAKWMAHFSRFETVIHSKPRGDKTRSANQP